MSVYHLTEYNLRQAWCSVPIKSDKFLVPSKGQNGVDFVATSHIFMHCYMKYSYHNLSYGYPQGNIWNVPEDSKVYAISPLPVCLCVCLCGKSDEERCTHIVEEKMSKARRRKSVSAGMFFRVRKREVDSNIKWNVVRSVYTEAYAWAMHLTLTFVCLAWSKFYCAEYSSVLSHTQFGWMFSQ